MYFFNFATLIRGKHLIVFKMCYILLIRKVTCVFIFNNNLYFYFVIFPLNNSLFFLIPRFSTASKLSFIFILLLHNCFFCYSWIFYIWWGCCGYHFYAWHWKFVFCCNITKAIYFSIFMFVSILFLNWIINFNNF